MTSTPFTRRIAVLGAAFLAACSAEVTSPNEPAAPNAVAVQVQPPSAQVRPGGSVTFAAVVTGTAVTTVNWTVQEGTPGGSVTSGGAYTAPGTAGTYHVVATSQADTTKSGTAAVTVTPPVAVAISPKTATVAASGTQTFTATVSGATNTAVTWSLQETSGCGSVTQAGVYTAPAAAATCHVVATSQADTTKSDVATVTVTAPPPPVTVSISPAAPSTNSCQVVNFTATVTGSANTAVTWSVQEGATGGTITSAGVYTAPANAGTYHVVATSQADTTKSAVAAVVVTDKIVSVAVSPSTTSVPTGGTAQFTATVTTTCGSFASKLTVTAPN